MQRPYRINVEIIDTQVSNILRQLPHESKSVIFRFVAAHLADIALNNPEQFSELYVNAIRGDTSAMLKLTGLLKEVKSDEN